MALCFFAPLLGICLLIFVPLLLQCILQLAASASVGTRTKHKEQQEML